MIPPLIDTTQIRRHVDPGAFERGVAYFRDGAVRSLGWDPRTAVVEAVVDGSGPTPYRCRIQLDPRRPEHPILSTSCTCPLRADCKHTVATMLASNRLANTSTAAAAPVSRASAPWRELFAGAARGAADVPLALGVELRQRVRRTASQWVPAKVEAATARGLHTLDGDVLVGLRPLERSARTETWIKGTVSWDVLRRPGHGYSVTQARWFAELHSIGRDMRLFGAYSDTSDWLTLDDIESGLLWSHLATADALGVAMVPTKKHQSVGFATRADVSVRAAAAPDGLRLAPVITIDGDLADAGTVRPIGHSGIYRFEVRGEHIELTLAALPLADPLPALLGSGAPLEIPEADAAEFVREHLPRLARRVAVQASGIVVPEPERPMLIVRVRFSPGHRLDFSLAWQYGSGRRIALDAPDFGDRDLGAESAIREHLTAVWSDASPVPFAAEGALSGLDAADFSANLLRELESLADVRVELLGRRPEYRELSGDPHVAISTVETTDADWFDLGIVVTIDGRSIPFTPLFSALARGRRKLLLSDGAYFSLAHPSLQRLRDLIEEAGELAEWEGGPRISRYQTDFWADFEDLADEALPAVAWRQTVEGLRDIEQIAGATLPMGLQADLRPYQQAGFDWLAFLWAHRLGGILADDMGLGKTLQMLALMLHMRESGEDRPVLVVAPTSVISTWQSEAERVAPGLRVRTITETRAKSGERVADVAASADVIVTSYTLVRLDQQEFSECEWAAVVLDEAQFVKNAQTKLHRAVRDLRADVTFAITGTPLENTLGELWSLLSLTAPGLFPSARSFREQYVKPIEQGKVPENEEGAPFRAGRLDRLRRRIRPLMLRRTKELVAADLPPKQEQEVRVELGAAHRALYDTVLQRERQKVLGLLDDLDRNRFIVFRSITLLRMLSLAPGLIDEEYAGIGSSKLDALLEHLTEIVAEGHRALIFSQFTSFLQLTAERLDAAGIAHVQLDGSTRRRGEVIEQFRGGEAPVFLISLKAGGFGLTLTEADYVFLLDPWWNPAAEAQAVDRTHRIGQERPVNVYRMIASGTIEEKVMALQQRKARLFRAVMDDDALFSQAITADDIRALLGGDAPEDL